MTEHVDVLIVGAGLSGIGAACQLRTRLPGKSVAILESRAASGGTWDLFSYPGIRSDSDMFTFSYRWRPWPSDTALADGPLILDYVRTVAREHGVDELIRYHHRVTARLVGQRDRALDGHDRPRRRDDHDDHRASCGAARATTTTSRATSRSSRAPRASAAQMFHPQHWPDDLDYAGKRVVVIGSGATAVTLVPAMAEHRGPRHDAAALADVHPRRCPAATRWPGCCAGCPTSATFPIARWKNVLMQIAHLPAGPAPAAAGQEADPRGDRARRCPRASPSTSTSSPTTTRGSSGCAWCPTATCSGRSPTAARRSSPTPSRRSPRPASGSPPGASSRPTSWSPRPG